MVRHLLRTLQGAVMDWKNYLFSFQGRVNRAKIWLYILIAIGAEIVYFTVFWMLVGASGLGLLTGLASPGAALAGGLSVILAIVLSLVFLVAVLWTGFAVAVKRLHDRNKSGWWLAVFYIVPGVLDGIAMGTAPIGADGEPGMGAVGGVLAFAALGIIIWAFVELYCLRGTVGDNRFGPDPLAGKVTAAAPPA